VNTVPHLSRQDTSAMPCRQADRFESVTESEAAIASLPQVKMQRKLEPL